MRELVDIVVLVVGVVGVCGCGWRLPRPTTTTTGKASTTTIATKLPKKAVEVLVVQVDATKATAIRARRICDVGPFMGDVDDDEKECFLASVFSEMNVVAFSCRESRDSQSAAVEVGRIVSKTKKKKHVATNPPRFAPNLEGAPNERFPRLLLESTGA